MCERQLFPRDRPPSLRYIIIDVPAIGRDLVLGCGIMIGIGGLGAGILFGFITIHIANSFGNMVTLITYRQLRKMASPGSEACAHVTAPCRSLPAKRC